MARYQGQVKLVFRHYPLTQIHPNAFPAAEAVEAAGEQGAFWPMLEELMRQQRSLSPQLYESVAEELGLNMGAFRAALAERRYRPRIDAEVAEAVRLRLRGTPSFLVNGALVEGGGTLEQALDRAIQNALR